ncbi:dTMP kinase [Candidatus Micrarchaeota archaeon]|nr:dTMP kinase [Candidatus Micrarchaeota archaeon]
MKGIFIAVEGIDGAGKGYAMLCLQEYITGRSKKYDHVLLTREPTNSLDGQKLREILATEKDAGKGSRQCMELFIKDRTQHMEKHIKPALEKGYVVLTDRYKYSTMAFQAAQGIPLEELIKAQAHLPAPDLVFLLDLPVELAFQRMSERDANEKFEHREFSEKVRQNYLKLVKILPDPIVVIDSSKTKQEVFAQIKKAIHKSSVLPY